MRKILRKTLRSVVLLAVSISPGFACTSGPEPLGTIRFQVDENCPSCICEDYCLDQIDVQLWREGDLVPTSTETGACGDELVFDGLLAGSAFKLYVFMSRDGSTILSGISDTTVVVKDETETASISLSLSELSAQPILTGLVTDPILVKASDNSLLVAELGDLGSGPGDPTLSLDSVGLDTSEQTELFLSSVLALEHVQDIPGSTPQVRVGVCGIPSEPLPLRVLLEEPTIQDYNVLVCPDEELSVAASYGASGEENSDPGFVLGCATPTGGQIARFSDTSCLAFEQVALGSKPIALSVAPDGNRACVLTEGSDEVAHIDFGDGTVQNWGIGDDHEPIAIASIDEVCFALVEEEQTGDRSLVELGNALPETISVIQPGLHREVHATADNVWILSPQADLFGSNAVLQYNRSSSVLTQFPVNDCIGARHLSVSPDESRFAVACNSELSSVQIHHVADSETVIWQGDSSSEELLSLEWDRTGDVLFARTAMSIFVLHHDLSASSPEIVPLVQWEVPTGAIETFMLGFSQDDRLLLEGAGAGSFRTLRSYVGAPECNDP